jgi:hypothetical protein
MVGNTRKGSPCDGSILSCMLRALLCLERSNTLRRLERQHWQLQPGLESCCESWAAFEQNLTSGSAWSIGATVSPRRAWCCWELRSSRCYSYWGSWAE